MVFNGAVLGEACVIALDGKVHIDTELADETWVPMGYIAFGRPGRIYPPDQSTAVHEELNRLGFTRYVFGVDPRDKRRADIMDEVLRKYVHSLGAHRRDTILENA